MAAPTATKFLYHSACERIGFLNSHRVTAIKRMLEARTFCHVTPKYNLDNIRKYGLQTQYGGSERGASALFTNMGFQPGCKVYIHLGKDSECKDLALKPTHFYPTIFQGTYVRSYILTVLLSAKDMMLLENDPDDDLPGRYKIKKDIPPAFIFFTALENIIRKPGTIGADGEISDEALDSVMPSDQHSELSHDEKIEYLRGALHDNQEPLYPSTTS